MALMHVNFFSNTLGMAVQMDVIIPQTEHRRNYQTLYLLHGMSDDHTIWQRRTSIERYAYEESAGDHQWKYWDEKIKTVLNWLPLRN